MSVVKSNPDAETEGVAPKVAYPTVVIIAIGVIVCVLDQLGVIDVDDGLWLAILGSGGVVAGVGGAAPAALQKAKSASSTLDA